MPAGKDARRLRQARKGQGWSPRTLPSLRQRRQGQACKPLSPERQARDRERRRRPEYLAKNLEAAHAWQARNKVAVQARETVSKAVKAGVIAPAKTCQILGCRKRSGLHGHHNSYAPRNHTRVVWLCRPHHQSVHAGMRFKTKAAAAYRTAYAPETA